MSNDEDTTVPEAPQNPGDPGYEPPAILPELDGEGGTVFKLGDEEFETLEEAEEARAQLVTDHAESLDDSADTRERDE